MQKADKYNRPILAYLFASSDDTTITLSLYYGYSIPIVKIAQG